MQNCERTLSSDIGDSVCSVNMGWQAYTTPEYVVWFSRLCYNFVLTSVPLSERHFLYDIMSGSLKFRLAMVQLLY